MFRGFATTSFYADNLAAARTGTPSCWAPSRTTPTPTRPRRRPTWSSGSATTRTSSVSSTAGSLPAERPTAPAAP